MGQCFKKKIHLLHECLWFCTNDSNFKVRLGPLKCPCPYVNLILRVSTPVCTHTSPRRVRVTSRLTHILHQLLMWGKKMPERWAQGQGEVSTEHEEALYDSMTGKKLQVKTSKKSGKKPKWIISKLCSITKYQWFLIGLMMALLYLL